MNVSYFFVLIAVSITLSTAFLSETQRPTFLAGRVSSSLRMKSAFTSANFELPDDLPEDGPSISRGISSSELRRVSEARRRRLQEEEERNSRYVFGDDLHELRQKVLDLREELNEARRAGSSTVALEKAILQAQQLDAEFIYEVALERMEEATLHGDILGAEKHRREAMSAREALPQFNLDGLWVGKYGSDFEMINVTYVGDTLIAYKVTGDNNVPKGEVSFSVNLTPGNNREGALQPIELGKDASKLWGLKYLQRFSGQGQVAAEGFSNAQMVEGQLILVGNYFSFAWLPISHQVFFGRPSAELTLKLLRESRPDRSDSKLREHLSRCLEETVMIEEELEIEEGLFPSHNQEDYYNQVGCFE